MSAAATAALVIVIGHPAAHANYTEHQHTELHGFDITDATHGRTSNSAPERELIWVGTYGEGRWLRPEEVLELAAALESTANAHIERIAREQITQLSAAPVYTQHQYNDHRTIRSIVSSDGAGNEIRLQTPHLGDPIRPWNKPGLWYGSTNRMDAQGRGWRSPLTHNYVTDDFGSLVAVPA